MKLKYLYFKLYLLLMANYFIQIITLISVVALSIITYFYLNETRAIRKVTELSVLPAFSLIPDTWDLGGGFQFFEIINSGGNAKEISIDIRTVETSAQSEFKFYILSLNKNGTALIPTTNLPGVISNEGSFSLNISCKDINNEEFKDTLTLDFATIKKQDREIVYQTDPLNSIAESLKWIKNNLNNIRSQYKR